MKLTQEQLKKIIKEEVGAVLSELSFGDIGRGINKGLHDIGLPKSGGEGKGDQLYTELVEIQAEMRDLITKKPESITDWVYGYTVGNINSRDLGGQLDHFASEVEDYVSRIKGFFDLKELPHAVDNWERTPAELLYLRKEIFPNPPEDFKNLLNDFANQTAEMLISVSGMDLEYSGGYKKYAPYALKGIQQAYSEFSQNKQQELAERKRKRTIRRSRK